VITSSVQQLGKVPFPVYTGERVYMREFTKKTGLPKDLSRWQDTVDAMLDKVDAPGSIFIMIDQAPVVSGNTHRRPGLHVDGYWNPSIYAHGHGGSNRWKLKGHDVGHRLKIEGHSGHTISGEELETLVLATDVLGCAGYVGNYDGFPKQGGDCSHIDTSSLLRVELEPNRAWAGHTLTMLHESIPIMKDCLRTVVRLNVKGTVQ